MSMFNVLVEVVNSFSKDIFRYFIRKEDEKKSKYFFKQNITEFKYSDGRIEYRKTNGKLHNENDLPAVIYKSGTNIWYKNGKCHRDGDLPAIVCPDGSLYWYKNDKLHRKGKPAIIESNDNGVIIEEFYENGSPVGETLEKIEEFNNKYNCIVNKYLKK